MQYTETKIAGVYIIKPRVFEDSRGYFMESFHQETFTKNIGPVSFIQDNESKSSYGVLRGLHLQKGEFAQAKLVRVVEGKVLDVAVDIRKDSPTYGEYVAVELSDENKHQLFIPRGLAHGFLVLSEVAVLNYKVDNVYAPTMEVTLNCFDPDVNIQWPIAPEDMILSEKDQKGASLKDL